MLAFVMQHPHIAPDTYERAELLFEDLETRLCPRVIVDARDFAAHATLRDVIEYVFAD